MVTQVEAGVLHPEDPEEVPHHVDEDPLLHDEEEAEPGAEPEAEVQVTHQGGNLILEATVEEDQDLVIKNHDLVRDLQSVQLRQHVLLVLGRVHQDDHPPPAQFPPDPPQVVVLLDVPPPREAELWKEKGNVNGIVHNLFRFSIVS